MIKYLFLIFLQVTLQVNTNDNANELKQYLNKNKDSIILKCTYPISKVEVYNNGYRDSLFVSGNSINISNRNMPLGRNTISVFTNRKIIVFNLIKFEEFENSITNKEYEVDIIGDNIDFTDRIVIGYWVEYEVNSRFGSHRSEFLSDKKEVEYLIRKNKIDLNTKNGYLNKLRVIEIYNLRAFMDFRSEGSFNKKPYYSTGE